MAGCTDCGRHRVGQRTKQIIQPLRRLLAPIIAPMRKSVNRTPRSR